MLLLCMSDLCVICNGLYNIKSLGSNDRMVPTLIGEYNEHVRLFDLLIQILNYCFM
jgi:hypothetical protein